MSATVSYYIELHPTAVVMADRLRNLAAYKIPLAIKAGFDTAMPEVIADIKEKRLSGKGPFPTSEHRLGEVTGLLKSSVTPIQSTMDTTGDIATIEGGIQVIGVPYANIHEFGFVGEETVSAHSRRYVRIRTVAKTGGRLLKRPVRTTTTGAVKAFTRHMNMPVRAPFRTGMEENIVRIKDSVRRQLAAALENV